MANLPAPVSQFRPVTFQVVDYRTTVLRGTADASGIILATADAPQGGYWWRIDRITVSCTSTTPTVCVLYAGSDEPGSFLDGTNSGNLDVADQNSPIMLETARPLLVKWLGASVGATGVARVQYALVERV